MATKATHKKQKTHRQLLEGSLDFSQYQEELSMPMEEQERNSPYFSDAGVYGIFSRTMISVLLHSKDFQSLSLN